jgi:hypothetical protein
VCGALRPRGWLRACLHVSLCLPLTHDACARRGVCACSPAAHHPQGLADTFLLLGMPFDSSEAAQLNKEIFECIYFAGGLRSWVPGVCAGCDAAREVDAACPRRPRVSLSTLLQTLNTPLSPHTRTRTHTHTHAHPAMETSCRLAKEQGPYETYAGSPVSKGILQHDMWGVKVRARAHAARGAAVDAATRVRVALRCRPPPPRLTVPPLVF